MCLEGSYSGAWQQPQSQRLLLVMPEGRKPSRGTSGGSRGRWAPHTTTHHSLAKVSHMAPASWEGPEVPFLPCWLSSAFCSGQPPLKPYQCKPQSASLLSGIFLACPFRLPDRVGPACSKAPGVHLQYSTSITWFREMDESCLPPPGQ